ncbi:ZZ-type zinc finger-containing protein [Actinidia chinensis var. chinensis]|uniref:ZZ-type zinc finger-containing protein n=1 Tax=Actinidia chinensis var. chinensis TaxID=1590841 RepID=A0A2R6P6L3_ACTCC|nr:ZZ-type zinc finger-containing protein [Actinidia chinensis var. chinensis]
MKNFVADKEIQVKEKKEIKKQQQGIRSMKVDNLFNRRREDEGFCEEKDQKNMKEKRKSLYESCKPINRANPSGNNQESNGNGASGAVPNDTSAAVGPTQAALRHNPGLAVEWTAEEQSLLEDLLNKYASERNIIRYAKIAMQLKDKTVRDVALRCRWMNVSSPISNN